MSIKIRMPNGLSDSLKERVLKLTMKAMKEKGIEAVGLCFIGEPDVWAVGNDDENTKILVDGYLEIPKRWLKEADSIEFEKLKDIIKKYL